LASPVFPWTITMRESRSVQVRIDRDVPKLLLKLSPVDAERLQVQNLAEVVIGSACLPQGRAAVISVSDEIPSGIVLMSEQLSRILEAPLGAAVTIHPKVSARSDPALRCSADDCLPSSHPGGAQLESSVEDRGARLLRIAKEYLSQKQNPSNEQGRSPTSGMASSPGGRRRPAHVASFRMQKDGVSAAASLFRGRSAAHPSSGIAAGCRASPALEVKGSMRLQECSPTGLGGLPGLQASASGDEMSSTAPSPIAKIGSQRELLMKQARALQSILDPEPGVLEETESEEVDTPLTSGSEEPGTMHCPTPATAPRQQQSAPVPAGAGRRRTAVSGFRPAHRPQAGRTPSKIVSQSASSCGHAPRTVVGSSPAPVGAELDAAGGTCGAAVARIAPNPTSTLALASASSVGQRRLGRLVVTPLVLPEAPVATSGVSWTPVDGDDGVLESSTFGPAVGPVVALWLRGGATSAQVIHIVADHCTTKATKVGGHQSGGALGSLVGGWPVVPENASELLSAAPAEAVEQAYAVLGTHGDAETHAVNVAYRKACLEFHPHRGGSADAYAKVQIAMEIIRGHRDAAEPRALDRDTVYQLLGGCNTCVGGSLSDGLLLREMILGDEAMLQEVSQGEAQEWSRHNRAVDDYVLRLMRLKAEAQDEIAQLRERWSYSILGVGAHASAAEIRKAYRRAAMLLHPDKGGDAKDFQQLLEAYEKVMEQKGAAEPDDSQAAQPSASSAPQRAGAGFDSSTAHGEPEANDEGEAEIDPVSLRKKLEASTASAICFATTARGFADQAKEAHETCVSAAESTCTSSELLKSLAHSGVVLALTVVKAVRACGYGVLDVGTAASTLAKLQASDATLTASAAAATAAGFDALNAAGECASATEAAAKRLQVNAASSYVEAAAMASAAACDAARLAEMAAQAAQDIVTSAKAAVYARAAAAAPASAPAPGQPRSAESVEKPGSPKVEPIPGPPESEAPAIVAQRLHTQRVNNKRLLVRLNSEILEAQATVKSMLVRNPALIPEVSVADASTVLGVIRDSFRAAALWLAGREENEQRAELVTLPLFSPLLEASETVAVSTCSAWRMLRLAALLDVDATVGLLRQELVRAVPAAASEVNLIIAELQRVPKVQ